MPGKSDEMTIARKFAIVLGLLLLVAVPFGLLGPTKPDSYDTDTYDTSAYDTAVSEALSDAASNEARSQGAPQQAVVNGWLARDLAIIQIEQANDEITQNVTRIRQTNDLLILEHTIAAVLVAVVLALVCVGLIARRPGSVSHVEEAGVPGFLPTPGSPGDGWDNRIPRPGSPPPARSAAAWPAVAPQPSSDELANSEARSAAPPTQATATLPAAVVLPTPRSAVEVRDHLAAEHGWPTQPAEAAMMEAHQFAHGARGRTDLADEDLTHTHSVDR
jgi:hypothetical protein